MKLGKIIEALRHLYGIPAKLPPKDAFELVLFENVAYLVDDERRLAVWNRLKSQIGVKPIDIMDADAGTLARVIADGGMQPAMRGEKLRKAARIVLEEFDGDLRSALDKEKARSALKKFPGIGEPGADKILMMTRRQPVLALESNGLRVLVRLGFGKEVKDYAATYRLVQKAVEREIRKDFDWLIEAHQLLRTHGQTLCKRTKPRCGECPLAKDCPSAEK